MAQFDVFQNPSKTTRKHYPYVVDIQNPVISDIATRIVIPLGIMSMFRGEYMSKLTLEIEFDDQKYILLTPQLASMPSKHLKKPVGTIQHLRDDIIASLDFAITG
ncbi:MAG: CcdB family protein [Gammaproteobacteria bacterium]|nr:CcdB family protein [Gammaproteobacteria bacterium]